ncbi:MAG TPA: DUF4369 domain-containing protein, partial [Chitinophagaceae bacterium]|nr:DUF4369 domain-containing protein [Chitinophagaceae bacterium]
MKYLFNYILAASTLTSGISLQTIKNQFVLDGTIKGQEQEWIYLGYQDAGGKYVRDSAAIVNYRFSFKGTISEPTRAFLGLKQKKGSSGNDVKIFLEPGAMTVVLETGHFGN